MARQSKNFFGEEPDRPSALSYLDGFKFGLGFFIAWLLGLLIVGGLATVVASAFK